jgi:biotin-dependent carboxylase-like uncharacterized protein
MTITVLAPGLSTTVQDAGRTGWRHLGVGVAGALDGYSHAIANLLVGNPAHAPTLEISLSGPRLQFAHASTIALCGASIDARCGGTALPGWRPITLPAGAVLELGACRRGARAYLGIAGGLSSWRDGDVDVSLSALGSASTDLRSGFGGVAGRALAAGDILLGAAPSPGHLAAAQADGARVAPWWVDPAPCLRLADTPVLRMLPGADALAADGELAGSWQVSRSSNRQGVRLEGAILAAADTRQRISEPVTPGTVQLPPDGQPIVLLADAQTHGGYPRIGHVIQADLPMLAQLRAGQSLSLSWCSAEVAAAARRLQRQHLARIAIAVQARR